MRDLLGSTIMEGSLLWWIAKQIPIRVARIEEPSKLEVIGKPRTQPKTHLVLEITIPLDATTDGAETQLADFLCIVNPEAQAAMDKMLGGQRPQ
jgi:hypothetical protein